VTCRSCRLRIRLWGQRECFTGETTAAGSFAATIAIAVSPKCRLTNILSQHRLNLLLRVTTLDDQTLSSIDRTRCTQFREQELDNVLWLPVHPSANVWNVGKQSLFCTVTGYLRGCDGVASLLTSEFGVVGVQKGEEAAEELGGEQL
jgi:hypothetical protein